MTSSTCFGSITRRKPGAVRVLAGNHHGHVVVEDLDRQVVALLPKQLLRLPALDHSGPMVRIDDVVARVERALDGAELVADLD